MVSKLPALSAQRFGVLDDFQKMRRDMDHWIDRLWEATDGGALPTGTWSAPVSLWEDGERFYLEVELPGVSKEDIDLTVLQGHLRITAERKAPEEERRYWHNERRFGHFERSVYLPEGVDPDSIHAELDRGVLHVTLAKRPEAQPRKITVKAR